MDGASVITQLKQKLKLSTDRELAEKLGISLASVSKWKVQPKISARQAAGLVEAALKAAEVRARKETENNAVRTIVEYFPLNKCKSRSGAKYELFESGNGHQYLAGLRAELSKHHGVYVFYDSRGHAIYVGKAKEQKLWKELNDAFNRVRDVQKIMRVPHPERNQPFKTSEEKTRQIKAVTVKLHDIATYVSVYQVADGMIKDLEAMLVRSFANDLLNIRMEKIG